MDQQTIDQFNKHRTEIIASLRSDPRRFASNLYIEKNTGPFWNRKLETSSPYLQTNDAQLCCLIDFSSTKIKPNICMISKVTPLQHQGKEGQTLMVKSGTIKNPKYYIIKVFDMD